MSEFRLGIDTAGAHLALALTDASGALITGRAPRVERQHASLFIPELEQLLHDADAGRDQIASIHVGIGPGSYTGLRVGLAAAQGLATAWSVPLHGGCSLATLAWGTLLEGETGLAWLDARRGKVYGAVFRKTASGLEILDAPAKRSRDEMMQVWPEVRWLDDAVPDASYLTRETTLIDSLEPRYW